MSDTTIRTGMTNAGLSIIAKTQFNQATHFTKVKIGDGILSESDNPADFIDLIHTVDEIPITDSEVRGVSLISITALITQATTGYWFREIGLFAVDPETGDEVLYAYGNKGANGTYIPSNGSGIAVEEDVTMFVQVVDSDNIVINFSPIYTRETTHVVTVDEEWEGTQAPYSKEITVADILDTDNPIIGLVASSTDYLKVLRQQEEYNKIYDVVTDNGKIILYADEKLNESIDIQIKTIR